MTYLTSGPLMSIPERRQMALESMAAELAAEPTIPDRGDSVRLLYTRGYNVMAVHCLVDEARALAFQPSAAKEMSES